MNTDVNRKTPRPVNQDAQLVAKLTLNDEWYDEHLPVGTKELLHQKTIYGSNKPSFALVEEKIQKHVFKNRIRLIEFFRDNDRHNCGVVSEKQFLAGLHLCQLPIDNMETCIIVASYTAEPSRVHYRNFCSSIDKVFTIKHLEENPLAQVTPPSRDWLVQGFNELSKEEEVRCVKIIGRFRDIIKQRRLLMAPFFRDFDKFLGNMGRVT
jgi:hypothetical protein